MKKGTGLRTRPGSSAALPVLKLFPVVSLITIPGISFESDFYKGANNLVSGNEACFN